MVPVINVYLVESELGIVTINAISYEEAVISAYNYYLKQFGKCSNFKITCGR